MDRLWHDAMSIAPGMHLAHEHRSSDRGKRASGALRRHLGISLHHASLSERLEAPSLADDQMIEHRNAQQHT